MLKRWATGLVVLFGMSCGLVSLAVDFNGDGTGDIAIFRASSGLWSVREITRVYFGSPGDNPVPGDYDGSGTDRVAICRTVSGLWAVRGVTRVYFGSGSDEAKSGDYNGDGTYDVGIFRESSGLWAIRGITRIYYGAPGDAALPSGKQCHLPVTGQTTSCRTGDDGDHQAGSAFNFSIKSKAGDMITIDHNTGLMWASDGDGEGCNFGNYTDWNSAIDCCNNLVFAGYDDWRLPNVKEIQSIVGYGTNSPTIDTTNFANTKSKFYWSSTSYNPDASFAWGLFFDNGGVYHGEKVYDNYIRAVRGGE